LAIPLRILARLLFKLSFWWEFEYYLNSHTEDLAGQSSDRTERPSDQVAVYTLRLRS
jgi:hypothetical protein